MKLKDWADKQGISYLTAWRWFKAGDPRLANAYQSDSGTIIVPDEADSLEPSMNSVQDSDIMSVILKKTVEFSKNQYPVEDFAAWILSNFTLKIKGTEGPKYSRQKPKPEEVQKHFQQFIKPRGEKPKPNMFVAKPEALDDLVAKSNDLAAQELVEEINKFGTEVGTAIPSDTPEVKDLMKDLSLGIATSASFDLGQSSVMTYDNVTEGVVARSVDLTPQQLNYTGSNAPSFSSNVAYNATVTGGTLSMNGGLPTTSSTFLAASASSSVPEVYNATWLPGQLKLPEQPKEEPVTKSRRGRKPTKK